MSPARKVQFTLSTGRGGLRTHEANVGCLAIDAKDGSWPLTRARRMAAIRLLRTLKRTIARAAHGRLTKLEMSAFLSTSGGPR
jgi:hypothetical protein